VFGSLTLVLIFALKFAAGLISPESIEGSAAPVPVPVVTPAFDCEANTPLPQSFFETWSTEFEPTSFNVTVTDLV
jgi:hypothetical protein